MIRTRQTTTTDTFASYGPFLTGGGIGVELDTAVTVAGIDTSGTSTLNITLPNATTVPNGSRILVQDVGGNAAAKNITVSSGGGTIHGDVTIADDYGSREYMTNGTDWFLCGSTP